MRCVDWIDNVMCVFPTLFADALELQRRDVVNKKTVSRDPKRMTPAQLEEMSLAANDAIKALSSLSRACVLTEKLKITETELQELDEYVYCCKVLNNYAHCCK